MGMSSAGWPRWPGWHHLPREARDTLFLLAVIAWTVLPHAGHLPIWCSALTLVVLLWRGALAVRGTALPSRWVLAAMLVLALALTWWSHRSVVGKEAGVTLLVTLVALKTLELRARRDALVVFFLGFFLVLTHFLYAQSLHIAASALVSVWGLLAALVLAHMPVGQPGLGLAARLAARLALLGAPVMVALFLLFPRIGPLWGIPQDAGAKTGLSGEMRMGMIAELATDDSIAMRLRVVSGRLPPPPQLYFRGPVLSAFDGLTWRIAASGSPASAPPSADLNVEGEPVELEVTLEPLRLALIPALEATPELPPLDGVRARRRDDLHWVTDRPVMRRQQFVTRSWPRFHHGPVQAASSLQEALELPSGHNPRTLSWAAALRRDPRYAEADAHMLAEVVLAHIRTQGYGYTLTPGTYDEAQRGTAVDEFWFDRKLGFCEHYASAFVVVMRALGVPARIVTGYQGAERDEGTGTLVVRQSFAHAWAEYWQPGEGWLRADPTAAVAPERIDRSQPLRPVPGLMASAINGLAPGMLLRARELRERVNHHWNQWVLNYSRGTQFDLMRRMGVDTPSWDDLVRVLVGLLCAVSLAGAAWAAWDQRRQDPWLRAWARVRRAAALQGLPADDHVPPRALATALQHRHGEAARPVMEALRALEALRYAREAPPTRGGPHHLAKDILAALRALEQRRSPMT